MINCEASLSLSLGFCYHLTQTKKTNQATRSKEDYYSVYKDSLPHWDGKAITFYGSSLSSPS